MTIKAILKNFYSYFRSNKPKFTDAQEVLGVKSKIFVSKKGELYFISRHSEGEIIGIIEYNQYQKTFLRLPKHAPALDYLAEIKHFQE